MSKPEHLRKHALDCLRLQADCMQLAGDARNPDLQSHFVRMARNWLALAVSGPGTKFGQNLSKDDALTT